MALKDWKLEQKSLDDIVYKKKNGLTKLFIIRDINQWNVSVPGFLLDNEFVMRVFKTKSAALKFAKEYMRKH